MAEPSDMILPLLREIQADLASFRRDVDGRLDKFESGQKNIRAALAGETVLSRMLVGEYEDRIERREQKVKELEARP